MKEYLNTPTSSIHYQCHQARCYRLHCFWKQMILMFGWTNIHISDLTLAILLWADTVSQQIWPVKPHTPRGSCESLTCSWLPVSCSPVAWATSHALAMQCLHSGSFTAVYLLTSCTWSIWLQGRGVCCVAPCGRTSSRTHFSGKNSATSMPAPLTQISTSHPPFHHPESSSCTEAEESWKEKYW